MTPPEDAWLFDDPPNMAVVTTRRVKSGEFIVDYVSHDEDDRGWQFLSRQQGPVEEDAMIVSLRSMVSADPTLEALAELPLGWRAGRDAVGGPWTRGRR